MRALVIALAVLVQFLVACAQYNMKVGARRLDLGRDPAFNLKNPPLMLSVVLFLAATVLSILTMRYMQFSIFYSFTALNYLFIMFFSWRILREKFDRLRLAGNILVIIGVIVFNLR